MPASSPETKAPNIICKKLINKVIEIYNYNLKFLISDFFLIINKVEIIPHINETIMNAILKCIASR